MRLGLGIGLDIARKTGEAAVAPSNTVAPVISGSTSLGSTLTSTTGTWSGNPLPTYSYQWKRGATNIGTNSSTYVTVVGDSLANITCVVTATNIVGSANATSNTLTMANYTPANTVAPAVSGTEVVGQVLTTTNGTWTNSPSSYSYQWKRGATNIGTNASTYTLLQADAGNTSNITCVVTATNAAGSANATSNTIAQILDATWYSMQTTLSISDSTTINAMNTFTISRKTALATSSVTEYPMIGGTATTVVRNLYNPADTNAAKRMTISGTVTCNSNGITGNGTNGYLNMYVNDQNDLTSDFTFYWYSRTNEDRNDFIYGATSSTFIGITHQIKVGGNTYYYARTGQTNGGALTRTDGFFLCKLSGNTFTLKRNNVQIYSTTVTQQSKQNLDMYFFALNRGGGLTGYSQKNFSHFSVLNVATTTQQDTDLYNAVLAKEIALSRSVNIVVSDPDAQAFVNAAELTSQTQADAINTLVIGMKAQGIWTKMNAVYPFVGGTATSHMYNLKDPRNLDAAFRLSFLGTVTHTANGVQGNGTNGYADTFFIPNNNGLTVNNNHLSIYSRTAAAGGATNFFEIGSSNASANSDLTGLSTRRSSDLALFDSGVFTTNRVSYTETNGSGFFLGKVNSDLTSKLFRNGTQVATRSIATQAGLSSYKTFILGFNENNVASYFSAKQIAFASMGTGLSDTEVSNYYTLVQAFQTTLGRQV